MILFHLVTHSGVPPYLQIVQQVKRAIRLGQLRHGDKLPTVKEAVKMVAVNPNTVVKAYKELEGLGLAEGHAGIGTFIRVPANTGPPPGAHEDLGKKLREWIVDAEAAGLDKESIEDLFYVTLRDRKGE